MNFEEYQRQIEESDVCIICFIPPYIRIVMDRNKNQDFGLRDAKA